ncbi:putative ribonuclease H-like domain-containing protein [Tanacetum coccineum]
MEGVITEMPITTAEEKAQRRLEVKARSTLMMGIPNEHQLKFNSIKDAKKLLEAVEKRFGGNAATRKTQRNLLKQQYENFTAPSSEMLDQTFDRLQKLVSQLELLDEKLLQEDVNQKLLRSLSPEWNTHAVVWRNKADLDTMSMDDLYNNLKVYEPEVKGMSSSSSSTQNMAFVSSSNNNTSSTNEAVNTAHGVSTASTQVNAANLGIIVNRLKSGSYRVKSGRLVMYAVLIDLDLFKLAIVLQKSKQIQDFGPTSGIRASSGTLMMMKHHTTKMHQTLKVIQNGNSKKRISTRKDGVLRVLPPVSAAEVHAVKKERKARTILFMAIPKEHLRRFHGMNDAKEIWEAIRTRFGGNANSKKMQKAVLKQQFEAFTISSSEGLEKGYDRFQQLLSQLEAHGAEVSTEDANHKFLRSLPPAWSNLAMTMRTKPDVDTLSIDDLYNNLRVFEQELTSTSKSSASAQNVAFVSHSKSSTNKVKSGHTGAYSTYTPSTSSNNIPEREVPAGFADEVIYSLFAKQSEDLDLLHEDLEQIDDMDIEEMDINWQIAMIAIRMKKFYKKTGRRVRIDGNKPVGFDKKKLECFKCHNTGHFARECPSKGTNDGKKRDSFYQDQGAGKKEQNQNCLLTMDDGVVNWGEHTEEEVETNHALMAISSNNEVSLCSKTCIDLYNKLKTLCDEQTNQLGEQEVTILSYDQAVKKLEAQVVTFQKKQLSLNEQLTFQANELYEKDEKLKKYRRIGMKAVKEKEQLQKTVDSWKNSSKNLWKLVDSGMSSTSKVGLGYEIKSNDEVLSYEEEMNRTVFNCTEEDFVDKPLYSRFSKTDNFKGVPHPLTGDYTPQPQQEIDDSLYVYGKKGPQKPETSVSDDKFSENSVTSNEEVVSAPKPKEAEPSCVTHVQTPKQPMKNQGTPKVNGKNWNEMMERKLGEGYSFIKKKCFVCGSLSHLIRNCDFYEKKMAREAELKKQRVFNTGNGVAKPVWNNANRVNHANHFVPRPVQLIAVRQNVNSVRPNVNTGRANVNSVRSNVNTGSFNINTVKAKQPINTSNSNSFSPDHPLKNIEDKGIFDSGCSGHMTGNKDHLDDFEECKRGYVTFGGSKGYITGKGKISGPRLFLAFASFMGFIVYQMDVKSAFLYGTIDEEVYVSQPPGFVDPDHPKKVYKVIKALYGLHQAPRAWYATLSTFLEMHGYIRGTVDKTLFIKKDKKDIMLVQVYVYDIIFGSTRKSWCDEFEALMKGRFQMSSIGELIFFLGLQVKQTTYVIFISQDKYVADMLKKFDLASVKTTITPMETKMALTKDDEVDEVDVHIYRSMIGSLMYLTASRPDIMFAVCACSRFQVTPKTSHLNVVKRIFKYLKGKPNLGLWYPKESSFNLEAYSDSDYTGANLDRKSITGGCQFLRSRLISWQCKKQTIVATSTIETEYVAAASCCRQVLWIQNQMLDYGFNFMNTKIHIDNESTICIVKNPKLIRVEKIHSDFNVADLLTKAFDGPRYALTHNPSIHDSLVKQFWQTATVSTLADGTLELRATIDTPEYTITEASVRSKLQLADASRISMLLNT